MSSNKDNARIELQERALTFQVWSSCLNCHYWRPNETKGKNVTEDCSKFQTKPPLKVIVLGCQEWLPVVPF